MVEGTYIFDCEVFAHDWLFVFKEVATGEYTVIWNDNDEVLAFMERNPYLGGLTTIIAMNAEDMVMTTTWTRTESG